MKSHADYDSFAWLYNREWAFFALNIYPLLKHLAGEYLPDGGQVLDLCCGTGQLAGILTEHGYKVTGIDISAGQLKYARQNAPAARFIRADARSFTLKKKFDAVFCTFDALNHILNTADLEKAFKSVSACLADDGIFVFDLITKREFELHTQGENNVIENDGYVYFFRCKSDPAKRVSQTTCTLFRRSGKNWKRTDTAIQQTFYTNNEIKAALRRAGLKNIHYCAADPGKGIAPPDKHTRRVFYFVRKT
jgi:SAM-dependent methyltransferase